MVRTAFPANDTERILKLTALFESYRCEFELVLASELNNLDAVQAAWNFPNVHVGGMWWVQLPGEHLPGQHAEWSSANEAGEFLWERPIWWIDEETALDTANEWFYASAVKRYGIRTEDQ